MPRERDHGPQVAGERVGDRDSRDVQLARFVLAVPQQETPLHGDHPSQEEANHNREPGVHQVER